MENLTQSPTPWHVSGSKVPIVYDANGWAVCNAVVFHGRYSDEQCMGNARLIAAAPDLLAALIEAEDALSDDGEYPFTLRRIRAAIAKAKGN